MSDAIRCPHCTSKNVKHSILGYGERVVTYTVAYSAEAFAKTLGPIFRNSYVSSAISRSIIDYVPSEYICISCGKKFHIRKQ